MNVINQYNPLNYYIHLELDVNSERFSGYTEILFESTKETDFVILHSESLAIEKCLAKIEDTYIEYPFYVDVEKSELKITIPKIHPRYFSLKIIYEGTFHDDLLGLYKSKYEHDNTTRYIIASQFEEIYARRVFPCIDHPSQKAIFHVEFIIDKNFVGVSNTSIKEECQVEGGKKKIIFNPTPRMSTYLLFFAVGDFEIKEDNTSNHLVRLITTPNKSAYGDLGIEMAIKSLDFCDNFTSIKYPISKCDLIALPDFAFGAMENYGAISFRENLLLVYPDLTSQIDKFHVASVVAHEVSHFWFGDLVSPIDWKYIWLNESFASFFTYLIPDHYYPEWHSWDHFILHYYSSALNRDGLINTFPVELPSEEEIFITPAKVAIVYNKGAAILRMLVNYLGENDFRKAITHFLNKYKFECANTEQYWDAFEESTHKEVKNFATSWIHQPGYPIIHVKRDKDKLKLIQNRFTYISHESNLKWLISCSIELFKLDGNSEIKEIIFDKRQHESMLPPDTYTFKLNSKQNGFYRIKYELDELLRLGNLIKNKKLPPIDRYGIENDLFALAKSGLIELDRYLEFIVDNYIDEDDYLPLENLFSNLLYCYLLIPLKRKKIVKISKKIIENILKKINIEPQVSEPIPISILRNSLIWTGFFLGSEDIARFGVKKFKDYVEGKKINPDILSSILKIGANLYQDAINVFLNKIRDGNIPQIEKLYIYEAIGCINDEKCIREILDMTLKEIPPQTWHAVFFRIGKNPRALSEIWPWFKENLSLIEKGGAFVIGRTLTSLIPYGALNFKTEVIHFLKDYGEKNEFQKDTIEMVLEQLEINSQFQAINK